MENKNYWCDFFKSLPKVLEKIQSAAKRSGISADAAILLTVIYEFPKLKLPVDKTMLDELILKGLILNNGEYTATGKGAILAKAFIELRNSVL